MTMIRYLVFSIACSLALASSSQTGEVHIALQLPESTILLVDSVVVDAQDLMQATGITVTLDHPTTGMRMEVVGFLLTASVNDVIMEAAAHTGELTGQQRVIIGKVPSRSTLYLESIQVRGGDGVIRTCPSKAIRVK
jgi:hypothetical protein